jgi:hypothetical protein
MSMASKPKIAEGAQTSIARFDTSGANLLKPGASYKERGGFNYIINSMFLVAIVGMCIKTFFGNNTSSDGTYGRANSTIYGYGVVAFAVLTVMFISFAIHDKIGKIEKKSGLSGIMDFVKSFVNSSAPSIITIIILGWIIALNVLYYERINMGKVATEYYQLSAGTSFLFMFQIVCLFQYLRLFIQMKTKTSDDKDGAQTQNRIAFATYFISAINLIVAGMMTIILTFFSTDG